MAPSPFMPSMPTRDEDDLTLTDPSSAVSTSPSYRRGSFFFRTLSKGLRWVLFRFHSNPDGTVGFYFLHLIPFVSILVQRIDPRMDRTIPLSIHLRFVKKGKRSHRFQNPSPMIEKGLVSFSIGEKGVGSIGTVPGSGSWERVET